MYHGAKWQWRHLIFIPALIVVCRFLKPGSDDILSGDAENRHHTETESIAPLYKSGRWAMESPARNEVVQPCQKMVIRAT
jgi:hypothetical protein